MIREPAIGLAPADLLLLSAAVSTRLCHDLAGPVGALNAGIELLADETDAAFITETAALLRHSAEAAAARLKFLRLAFGVSGAGTGAANQRCGDLAAVAQGFLAATGTGVTLHWRLDPGRMLTDRQARGVLLGVLAAFDLLRAGGVVEVTAEGAAQFLFMAQGTSAGLGEDGRAVLAGDLQAVSPRTAPLAMLLLLAGQAGAAGVSHTADRDGRTMLAVTLTAHVV